MENMNIDKKVWNELMSVQEELIEECSSVYERMNACHSDFKALCCLEEKLNKVMTKIENNSGMGDGSYEADISFSPKINRE